MSGMILTKLGQCHCCPHFFKLGAYNFEARVINEFKIIIGPVLRNSMFCGPCSLRIMELMSAANQGHSQEELKEMIRSAIEAIKLRSTQEYHASWKVPGLNQFDAQVRLGGMVQVKRTDQLTATLVHSPNAVWAKIK